MTNEEAKFILSAYRAGGQDSSDPMLAAALEQAKRDPVLAAWFAREQKHAQTVTAKLREIAPPPGLREAILAGGKVTTQRRAWWRQPVWHALAASLIVIATVSVGWIRASRDDSKALPEFALAFASAPFRLTEHGEDLSKLRAWLAAQKAPLPANIPVELARLQSLGCRTLEYRGKNISLICFEHGKEFHLFVANRADFPELPDRSRPEFLAKAEWAAATWSDAQNHYVLVSDAGMDAVRRLL